VVKRNVIISTLALSITLIICFVTTFLMYQYAGISMKFAIYGGATMSLYSAAVVGVFLLNRFVISRIIKDKPEVKDEQNI
jgi:hypothetical protein